MKAKYFHGIGQTIWDDWIRENIRSFTNKKNEKYNFSKNRVERDCKQSKELKTCYTEVIRQSHDFKNKIISDER